MTTDELEKIVAPHESIETACAFLLRGERILPTRRSRSPYTEVLISLHGGFGDPTRRKKRPYAGKE